MRRVPGIRIQVAPLIVSVILSRSKVSRRGLARALLPSVVPELPIRSRIFAPEGCLSQVAGAVTGSFVSTNILILIKAHSGNCSFRVILEVTYKKRRDQVRYYTKKHTHYCGIDLHARTMYLCILDQDGKVLLHKNFPSNATAFLDAVEPYMDGLVVCVECTFTWYWLADLCYEMDIPFVLGHALYMRAIHGGKVKNDRVDAMKIAMLLRGSLIPYAYVYPGNMRPTRDLLRRRGHLVQLRSEMLTHISNTNSQYCLDKLPGDIRRKSNRIDIAQHFEEPMVRASIEANLCVIETFEKQIQLMELTVLRQAKKDNPYNLTLLQSVPGIGKILSLTLLYEIHDIARFPSAKKFASYARLVKGQDSSAGKLKGTKGGKMGNVHLKWALSEAVVCMLGHSEMAKKYIARKQKRYGKGKAMSVMAHKIGRTLFYMLKRKEPFDQNKFFAS